MIFNAGGSYQQQTRTTRTNPPGPQPAERQKRKRIAPETRRGMDATSTEMAIHPNHRDMQMSGSNATWGGLPDEKARGRVRGTEPPSDER